MCCDLALDRILLYDFDPASGSVRAAPQPSAQVSSARARAVSPCTPRLDVVYLLNELDDPPGVWFSATSSRLRGGIPGHRARPFQFAPRVIQRAERRAQILVHPSGRVVYGIESGSRQHCRVRRRPVQRQLRASNTCRPAASAHAISRSRIALER